MYKIYLREKVSQTEYWSVSIDNIELVAGMLAAGISILDNINYSINNKPNSFSHNLQYYFDSNVDVSYFCLLNKIAEEDIPTKSIGQVKGSNLGIWMKSETRFFYNLYSYQSSKFIDGIYSICNAFNVDYRFCIYELPFNINYQSYPLPGYENVSKQIFIIPQENDGLDDVKEEEENNENLIEPLNKDRDGEDQDDVYQPPDNY